ncbi:MULTISPECIES: phosphate regulon sensor histidine kinase PhoR [Giesbergeria]|uniref:Phosphate regulon sensor protein PhoR n=1 Tax=Giesbergeria sinuosa TaxID=80883 RepID=A0ABV9QGB1_9BURK
MTWRIFIFSFSQIMGLLLGWWYAGAWGAAVGGAFAGWCWFATDLWRGAKVLRWFRHGELGHAPQGMHGLWGLAVDRVRRLLRVQQQQVQESERRLEDVFAALQASPNGLVLLDSQGHIEWCNKTACAHFGFDVERDQMQSLGNLVRDPDFTAYYNRKDYSNDVVLQGRSNTPARPVRLSVQIYPHGKGRKLMISRDITALEQAEAMRRDFVANVSHEIRTPLTVLAGFVETLQTLQLSTEEQTRYLGLMAQQAARMQSVVQGLLTLSRLEESPRPGMAEWVSVQHLLEQCADEGCALSQLLTRNQARQHTMIFPLPAPPEGMGEIAGVQAELQSALSNLISNAVRYTPASGSIEVSWHWQADGSAVFAVRDTGPGIDAVHIPRLTERFYRVDRSRSRETGGTGLGLAIVKHVLQRHDARLDIQSTLGQGSTFSVHFPANRVRPPTKAA